jgi:hypothetical protein
LKQNRPIQKKQLGRLKSKSGPSFDCSQLAKLPR